MRELRIIRRIRRVLERVGALLGKLEGETGGRDKDATSETTHDQLVIQAMTQYDMMALPDEHYYSRQYLHWVLDEFATAYPDRRVRIIDLGCGQGRLSIPLAEWCLPGEGSVTGVDFTPDAIRRAKGYVQSRELGNLDFIEGHVLDFLGSLSDSSIDVVLLLEVAYMLPSYRDVIREIRRVLRPRGLMFVSFRSRYFNLLHCVRLHMWEGAKSAIMRREGHIFGGSGWFTWQTAIEVKDLVLSEGFTVRRICGIGVASGIEGDPLSFIARPSELSPRELDSLMEIETMASEEYADCARYILAIGVKRGDEQTYQEGDPL